MKTAPCMDISFKLQHLEQISEFTEALFPSHLQGGYRVNCVSDGSQVPCGEAFKTTWSEEVTTISVQQLSMSGQNKELHINVRLH